LQASIDTIRDQNKSPSHTREGMYFMPNREAPADNRFREFFIQRIKEYRQADKNVPCLQSAEKISSENNLASTKSLNLGGLRKMIKTAREHNVELVLYAYPSHAYMLELTRQCQDQDSKWQAVKQIADLIGKVSAYGTQVRIYEFYGYNNITAEPIGSSPANYWHDPMHFSYDMGNMMLADMFGQSPPKLGRLISSENIDDDYRKFLTTRSEYLQLHPDFQANMWNLLPSK